MAGNRKNRKTQNPIKRVSQSTAKTIVKDEVAESESIRLEKPKGFFKRTWSFIKSGYGVFTVLISLLGFREIMPEVELVELTTLHQKQPLQFQMTMINKSLLGIYDVNTKLAIDSISVKNDGESDEWVLIQDFSLATYPPNPRAYIARKSAWTEYLPLTYLKEKTLGTSSIHVWIQYTYLGFCCEETFHFVSFRNRYSGEYKWIRQPEDM